MPPNSLRAIDPFNVASKDRERGARMKSQVAWGYWWRIEDRSLVVCGAL